MPCSTITASVLVSGLPPGDLQTLETMLARALTQFQPPDIQSNIYPTSDVFSLPNTPQLTTPVSVPASSLSLSDLLAPKTILVRALPRAQPPDIQHNTPVT